MIDHLGLRVSDYQRSKSFFSVALLPLGYSLLMEHEISGAGFFCDVKHDFWLKQGTPSAAVHVAFASSDRAKVDAFYDAALSAGGTCNGPPGLRAEYHPNYYGAFVLDPDGNDVEAACHFPE